MDDVAIYSAYYGHYHVRAVEAAAAAPSIPRKQQGVICALLAFGSLCGMATVAVGFVAHNPAIIWPVVAVGLIGVTAGLVLAHRKATGGWVWGSSPARPPTATSQQQAGAGQAGAAGPGAGVPAGGGFHLPMYCADAYDVEMGLGCPHSPSSTPALVDAKAGKLLAPCGDAASCSGGSGGSSAEDGSATELPGAGSAAAGPAAAAAEYGAVMCGVPLPGADGWIDTRPVLVLQPHPHLLLLPGPQSPIMPQQQQQPQPSGGADEAAAAAHACPADPQRTVRCDAADPAVGKPVP